MQHVRHKFSGDGIEKAYLVGFRAGDLNAWRKTRNTIEVRVSTTHPAMANLFSESFLRYGHVMADAGEAYLPGRYRWQMRAHLDNSFGFIISKASILPREPVQFYCFLAGYSDSECCWSVYFSKGQVKTSWSIESTDIPLLRKIRDRLWSEGFHPLFHISTEEESQGFRKNQKPKTPDDKESGTLRLFRKHEVMTLAERLLKISRHEEKISKMRLVLGAPQMTKQEIVTRIEESRRKIKRGVKSFEKKAEREYKKGKRPRLSRKGSSASLV